MIIVFRMEMKLLRPPKNMMGKEKVIEIKNPIFMIKYSPFPISLTWSFEKVLRKFGYNFSLPMRKYPIMPKRI
jgi:hypothetical protein